MNENTSYTGTITSEASLRQPATWKHGWSKHGSSMIISVFEGFMLEPCLLQPCFHVAVSELHKYRHRTTGHRLFCKELPCFNTTPCRHMTLLVHFWLRLRRAPSAFSGGDAHRVRHRLNGYSALRVPSLFLASSFRMCLNCEVFKGMFPWRTRYPSS